MGNNMHEEIPSLNELMELYGDDHHWNEYISVNNELGSICVMCHKNLSGKIVWKNYLQDYNYYLLIFLTRLMRISLSKKLLLIYERVSEAFMLNRPLLENLAETILFSQRRSRARLMRKMKLYWIINDEKSTDFYKELDMNFWNLVGYAIKYVKEHDEALRNKVEDELKEFTKEEIEKMRKRVENGHSWYGENPKKAFKECELFDNWFGDYRQACALLHVRERNPFDLTNVSKKEKELFIKMEFSKTLELVLFHLKYYENFCSEVFNRNDVSQNLKNLNEKIKIIQRDLMKEIEPSWDTFVPLR